MRSLSYEAILNMIKPQIPNKNLILDLLLLHNLLSEIINLFKSNKKFNKILYKNPQIFLLIRYYTEYITILYKIQNTIITIQTIQITKQSQLLRKQKK